MTKADKLDEILSEFRKTCFMVAQDMDNSKAVELMALTIIKTKSEITELITKAETQARIDELEKVAEIPSEVGKLANHSLKVSIYLEDRIKTLQDNNKSGGYEAAKSQEQVGGNQVDKSSEVA